MRIPLIISAVVATSVVLTVPNGEATAQNFERYRPLPLEMMPQQPPSIPRDPVAAAEGSNEVLLERLDAVIVLDDPKAVDAEEPFADAVGVIHRTTRGGIVDGPQVAGIISSYIGGEVTLRRLNEMSREIILLYRRMGRPVVDVILPEQKITGGTVQIVIVESRVGRVIIQGACWTSTKHVAGSLWCTHSGGPIYEPHLRDELFRMNEYPFRRVELDMTPGDQDGTTDLQFNIHDVRPIRGYVGYDDTGVRGLNYERLFAGFTVGDVLGADSLLSYQYTADGAFHRLNAHALFYQVPINQIWSFESYGSWAGLDPAMVTGLDQQGESWQAGFGLNRRLTHSVNHQSSVSAGFNFLSTNTNVEFGGTNVFGSTADLVTLRLGYRSFRRFECDEYLSHRHDLYIGPGGGFTGDHNQAAFETIRAGTSPDFVYIRSQFERLWEVPMDLQLVTRGIGQLASDRLLYSETLGLGDVDTVRGYDQRTLNADGGFALNFELGPRPWRTGSGNNTRFLRTYGFVDMGDAYTIHAMPGEVREQFLISTGLGMRMMVNNSLALRVDYGYGFKDTADNARNHRVHVGLVQQFGPRP